MSSFSGVHVDQKFDPLQSEPKKFKRGNDGYSCNDCEYVASRSDHLKRHVENKHIRIRYACDECDYVAKRADNLKVHVESKHEGVRYPCFQCEHVGTTAKDLKRSGI